jgi:hypothetical protein
MHGHLNVGVEHTSVRSADQDEGENRRYPYQQPTYTRGHFLKNIKIKHESIYYITVFIWSKVNKMNEA